MALEEIIVWLVIGAIADSLAGLIMKGYGFELIRNIVVGIIGAVIAGWLLPIGFVLVGGIVTAMHQRRYRGSDSLVRDRALQNGSVKSLQKGTKAVKPGILRGPEMGRIQGPLAD